MAQMKKEADPVKEAKIKASRFCAYRERTQQEVRVKLRTYGISGDQIESVIADLITEGFVNEERFALAYAGGKFRLKKWGRLKIKAGLERHQLTPYCINKALGSLPDDQYRNTLSELLDRKWRTLMDEDIFIKKHKVATFLMSKGFEGDLIWDLLHQY